MAHEAAARDHCPPPVASSGYTPRDAARTVLHQVVREHLETFLATTAGADPAGLPAFLEQEFRGFLDCGVWALGFARFQCESCHAETLVPFSCKRRGYVECWNMRSPEAAARAMSRWVGAAALVPPVRDFA